MKRFINSTVCLAVALMAIYAAGNAQPAAGQTASQSKASQVSEQAIKLTDQDVWMTAIPGLRFIA